MSINTGNNLINSNDIKNLKSYSNGSNYMPNPIKVEPEQCDFSPSTTSSHILDRRMNKTYKTPENYVGYNIYSPDFSIADIVNVQKQHEYVNNISLNWINNGKIQGITKTEKYTYISVHEDASILSNKPADLSKLYVYDNNTGRILGYINFINNAHVGGITYDKKNGIIYVTGKSGNIYPYDKEILEDAIEYTYSTKPEWMNYGPVFLADLSIYNRKENALFVSKKNDNPNDTSEFLDISSDSSNAATIYSFGDYLYITKFNATKENDLYIYKTEVTTNPDTNRKEVAYTKVGQKQLPNSIQGVTVTEYNGKKYLLATSSMGPLTKSHLYTYELDDNNNLKPLGFHYIVPGAEGIQIDPDGVVRVVSEVKTDKLSVFTMKELTTNYDKPSAKEEELSHASNVGYNVYNFITGMIK